MTNQKIPSKISLENVQVLKGRVELAVTKRCYEEMRRQYIYPAHSRI